MIQAICCIVILILIIVMSLSNDLEFDLSISKIMPIIAAVGGLSAIFAAMSKKGRGNDDDQDNHKPQ